VLTAIAILLATAGAIEGLLRLVDFRDLRDGYGRGYPSVFRHDAELGWFPVPNAVGPFQGSRTFNVANNSLGLRDVELEATLRPTVLFVGDAFLWGYDVEVQDRFTELLRKDLPGLNIVNAGIPGYGTTQEYLLLQRLWDVLKPDVVVLVVCAGNDRDDNSGVKTTLGFLERHRQRLFPALYRADARPELALRRPAGAAVALCLFQRQSAGPALVAGPSCGRCLRRAALSTGRGPRSHPSPDRHDA
jgi:hypothetical protein